VFDDRLLVFDNVLSAPHTHNGTQGVSKNCAFLFLSELRQMSTNFNKFWSVDGKMAEIVCYICTFHLTRLVSLHYLVKGGCSKFLPNTGFVTDCSDLVSKWRRHTVATTFLLTCHCQTCAGCPETIFYVSTGRHLDASARDTVAFLERERDARKASSSIGSCVRLRGTFRARILTILSRSVITTYNFAK